MLGPDVTRVTLMYAEKVKYIVVTIPGFNRRRRGSWPAI